MATQTSDIAGIPPGIPNEASLLLTRIGQLDFAIRGYESSLEAAGDERTALRVRLEAIRQQRISSVLEGELGKNGLVFSLQRDGQGIPTGYVLVSPEAQNPNSRAAFSDLALKTGNAGNADSPPLSVTVNTLLTVLGLNHEINEIEV